MTQKAVEKAQKNLALVVKAVGATEDHRNGGYLLKVKKHRFFVGSSNVYLLNEGGEALQGTCIQSDGLPPHEIVATLLLLLKHNPKLFESWRGDHHGHYGA